MATPSDKEVTQLAKELAGLGGGDQSKVYSMSFWNEKLLTWAMSRPRFKAQLFRFVDVFPATSTNADVLRHVEEYLTGPEVPRLLRAAIKVAGTVPFGATVTASQARANIGRMADQFILGETPAEAVIGARRLWDLGSGTTIDLLGEKTVAESEADSYAARVTELLDALVTATPQWPVNARLDSDDFGAIPRASISIKPTALASRYHSLSREDGIEQAKTRLRPILRRARDEQVLLWFDMEHYEAKEITFDLFAELLNEDEFLNLDAGLVFQAYLKDTYTDLAQFIEWSAKRPKPAFVRLVKGAYWDTETIHGEARDWPIPVFSEKPQSDANFERCARLLLDHHGEVRAAFASHNLRSLAFAIAYARRNGVPDNAFEVQMLYGMAEPMHEAVRRLGLRHRVYAPVGELVPGMAYLVRRLLENTSNESFVRLRFAEGRELDRLVTAPAVASLPGPDEAARRAPTDLVDPGEYEPEPLAQWHRPDVRGRMHEQVIAEGNATYVSAYIGGKAHRTADSISSVDPSQPDVIVAHSASVAVADVDEAFASAQAAWPAWRDTPARERAGVLFRAAEWMRQRRFAMAALQVREAGKPWVDADGDVCEAIDFCEYYGREMLRLADGGPVQSPPGETNVLLYQPRGVGVVISPWNFPLAIPTGMVVAALVTGNAVLFKPSEQTPAIAAQLVRALYESGLPKAVLQFLPGVGESVGKAMVEHPDASFVAFTGSLPVGLSIIEGAARHRPGQRHIKKVIAELGGKNPMIVDSDADLDQVVPAVMYSAFGFSGQKCSALSRLIILDSVRGQLTERLVGAMNGLKIGSPVDGSVDVGPVIDEEAQQRIAKIILGASDHGTVLASRSDLPTRGFFVAPTLVTDVDPQSRLAKEEIFGPVLSVFGARDIDHALALANDTDFALTAGIFSRSPSVINHVARSIRAGNVYVNRTTTGAVVGRQPFGGYGLSGVGTKAGGPDYLLHFMEPRVVTENTVRQGFAELT